jgi:hypothetical protein
MICASNIQMVQKTVYIYRKKGKNRRTNVVTCQKCFEKIDEPGEKAHRRVLLFLQLFHK